MPPASHLLVLFLLAQFPDAEPSANPPSSGLVIASDSSCPSADDVRQALASLRSADWPVAVVAIHSDDRSLSIDLGSRGVRQRELAVDPNCAARAKSAALVIATWMDDLPAEVTTAPVLRTPKVTPVAPPLPRKPAYQEVGAGFSAAMAGGWTPSGYAEFIRMRAERGLGWHASLGVFAPREIWVGNGVTRWMRTTAALALHARRASPTAFVAADLGLAFAYTAAWGTGYAENQSDRSINWGPAASVRAGIPWGRFRLWTDLRGWRWFHSDSVQIDSAASAATTSVALPSWEGQLSFGVSCVLP